MAKKTLTDKENISDDSTSVKITRAADAVFTNLCSRRGCAKIAAISRLVMWFSDQDETLQAVVLGQLDHRDELETLYLVQKRLQEKHLEKEKTQ